MRNSTWITKLVLEEGEEEEEEGEEEGEKEGGQAVFDGDDGTGEEEEEDDEEEEEEVSSTSSPLSAFLGSLTNSVSLTSRSRYTNEYMASSTTLTVFTEGLKKITVNMASAPKFFTQPSSNVLFSAFKTWK